MVLTITLSYGILMMKSLKQREQMADYNRDQMERDERTGEDLGSVRPRDEYVEKLGLEPETFPDNVRPKNTEELVKDLETLLIVSTMITKLNTIAGYNIEPLDYIQKNGLDFLGNIIKYVSRYDMKEN